MSELFAFCVFLSEVKFYKFLVLYEKWITKQRDEREEEFAPPASYFR